MLLKFSCVKGGDHRLTKIVFHMHAKMVTSLISLHSRYSDQAGAPIAAILPFSKSKPRNLIRFEFQSRDCIATQVGGPPVLWPL